MLIFSIIVSAVILYVLFKDKTITYDPKDKISNDIKESKDEEKSNVEVGTFTQMLLNSRQNNIFEFRNRGVTYLLETDDILILDILKNGGKFAIKYEKIKSDRSRNRVYGKILDAKKV